MSGSLRAGLALLVTELGRLFPAAALAGCAAEAKDSRLLAGGHYPIDIDRWALGGGLVGRLVVVRTRGDGVEGAAEVNAG